MDREELSRFARVWGVAVSSGLYCYTLRSKSGAGIGRLLLVGPVLVLFSVLPFALNSINLGATTFFYLTWLGNFKLLLFAFGLGPLVSQPQGKPLSLSHFLAVALLPIKVKDQEAKKAETSPPRYRPQGPTPLWWKMAKVAGFLMAVNLLGCKHKLPTPVVQVLYFIQVNFGIEILLAITAVPLARLAGLEVEDQFRNPQLATSLQDFWGNRWNLMTSNILRLTVYNPLRRVTTPAVGHLGGVVVGITASFLVSGLMHELTYYHYTRVPPTWEVTWFFVLHGVCTCAEVALKFIIPQKWHPPPSVSIILTALFNSFTSSWLFFPQLLRNKVDDRLLQEYSVMFGFLIFNVC